MFIQRVNEKEKGRDSCAKVSSKDLTQGTFKLLRAAFSMCKCKALQSGTSVSHLSVQSMALAFLSQKPGHKERGEKEVFLWVPF